MSAPGEFDPSATRLLLAKSLHLQRAETPTAQNFSTPAPAQQQYAQQIYQQQQYQQQDHRQSASPHAPTPPTKYPMAAPPLPNTPSTQQAPASNAAPSPMSPQSPGSQHREQQRISLIFEINVELLQEVNRLQAEGHGGAISLQQLTQLRNEGKPDKMASDEYIQTLRRVQANIAYLMPKASNDPSGQTQAKAPPGPAHMTPPPHMPQLHPKYEQLRELFPGWPGMDQRPSQSSSSPRPNGPNATNGMMPPASAQA